MHVIERIGKYIAWIALIAIVTTPIVAVGFFIAGNPVMGGWLMGVFLGLALGTFGAYAVNRRVKRRRELEKRKAEGLMAPDSSHEVVAHSEWLEMCDQFRVEWLEDESQRLLPSDIVIRWGGSSSWTGLAINRRGKIVAVLTLMHIYRGSR